MKKKHIIYTIILLTFTSCATVNDIVYKVVWEKRDKVIIQQLAYNKSVALKNMQTLDSIQKVINLKTKNNPNTSAKELIPTISNLKDSLQLVVNDLSKYENQKKLDFNTMINFSNDITEKLNRLTEKNVIIETALNNTQDVTLKSDISFNTGSSDLKTDGKNVLKIIVDEIEKKINEWDKIKNEAYKSYSKKITIIVIGYADLQGSSNIDARKQKNIELSENRAKIVANNINTEINKLKSKYNIEVKIVNIGLGEELPPNVTDDKTVNNPKRRICMISTNVSLKID